LTETFGNVTLEAMASATPVLAFDCAAASDFVTNHHNGWLIDSTQPQAYINRALDITLDTLAMHQARLHTRASIEHLGWDEIAQQVEDIFLAAIENNK
jgi:glycosyltransferase involved in cell wall biosynthesis